MTDAPVLGEPLPVELMNTAWADRHGPRDALADVDGALAWLTSVASRTGVLTPADVDALTPAAADVATRSLRRLRNALRELAAEATSDDRPTATATATPRPVGPDAAAGEINRAASAPRRPSLQRDADRTWRRIVVAPRGAVSAALAVVAGEAVDLFAGPGREQLRACHGPGCVLYFVASQARREWCSAACGNRARVARHYRRHGAAGGQG